MNIMTHYHLSAIITMFIAVRTVSIDFTSKPTYHAYYKRWCHGVFIIIAVLLSKFADNCFDPIPPLNSTILYNDTYGGAIATYQCNSGFIPSVVRTSLCNNTLEEWIPAPQLHQCTLVVGMVVVKQML